MNRILNVVKDTFEKTKNIKVLKIYSTKNNIFGIYINSVEETLKFSIVPDISFQTDLEGYNIFLFELGSVLYNIYNNASLSATFTKMLLKQSDIEIETNEFYENIINFVGNNIPFFLIKSFLIKKIDEVTDKDVQSKLITNDINLMDTLHYAQSFIELSNISFKVNFLTDFIGENDTSYTQIKIFTALQDLKQLLMEKHYSKIYDGDIAILDNFFVNLQIMMMDV